MGCYKYAKWYIFLQTAGPPKSFGRWRAGGTIFRDKEAPVAKIEEPCQTRIGRLPENRLT